MYVVLKHSETIHYTHASHLSSFTMLSLQLTCPSTKEAHAIASTKSFGNIGGSCYFLLGRDVAHARKGECPEKTAVVSHQGSTLLEEKLFHQTFRTVHPGRLTWNLPITHLERKMIFQTSMIMFHVNLQGCT